MQECPGTNVQSITVPRETVAFTQGADYVRTEIMRQDATLVTYPTREVGGRYCLPSGDSPRLVNMTQTIIAAEEFSNIEMVINTFKDVCNAWSVLLFMLPVSMAVGYGYIFLLRYCARAVLHLVLATLLLASASLSFYCLYYIGDHKQRVEELLGKYTDDPQDAIWTVGLCSALLSFVLLCAGYSMYTKMDKISAVVEAAGDAMWSVQLLLSMPVLEIAVKSAYTLIWMLFGSYVITNGDVKGAHIDVGGHRIEGLARSFHHTPMQVVSIIVYCIGYLWGLEFIGMLFKFVVSYAVAIWYFQPCRADLSKPEITAEVWRNGFTYAIFYHVGSLSLGAAVTIVLYIFLPLHVINEFFLTKTSTSQNPVVKAVIYSFTCCIRCTHEIVSYVNKGAIVEMVLRGDHDFFASAGSATKVMRTAEYSVVSLHGVTLVFQIIGLLTSAAIGAAVTWWFTGTINIYADQRSEFFLEDRLGVTVISGLISMAVSTVFMWTLDLVSDSLLFCWIVEGEDDRTHQTYAPKALRNVVRFDDFVPGGDNRMIKGAGDYPYDGLRQNSHSGSPYNSQHNSPERRDNYNSSSRNRH
jgi:hypothetical protein